MYWTSKSLVDKEMKLVEIQEGLGTFLIPDPKTKVHIPRRSDDVFFNFHQEINRDFSVLALRAYGRENTEINLTVCEPLCGTGVRSARYALETPSSSIYCNDINLKAVKIAQKNIELLSNAHAEKIRLFNMDCNAFLQSLNEKNIIFDFADIDPFGTPIPFAQNSIKSVNLQGLLAFTATDLASLVGLYPRALYAKYCISQFDERIGNVHEMATRFLITGIQHVGLTLDQSLIPILSFYHRHFIRCFLLRNRGVDRVLDQTGFINYCKNCQTRFTSTLGKKNSGCHVCDSPNTVRVGPVYLGKIQNPEYLTSMLQDNHLQKLGTKKRLLRILPKMIEESSLDIPWSFDIPTLAKKMGIRVPPIEQIAKSLNDSGYKCAKSHYSGTSFKTDAQEPEVCSIISLLAL